MLTIILMESENAGNVGAIARAMANFGASKLILLSPKVDHLSKEAQDRAKYAKGILKKATVMDPEQFFATGRKRLALLVGTSAKVGTSYNMRRNPLTPRQLAKQLILLPPKKEVGLLLGREGIGLTNEEIAKCDLLITVPASPSYPVMNVSSAAAVVLYELFQEAVEAKAVSNTLEYLAPLTAREREQLVALANEAIASLDFFTPQKHETQKTIWRKLLGKSVISRREGYALMGYFRKVKEAGDRAGKAHGIRNRKQKTI